MNAITFRKKLLPESALVADIKNRFAEYYGPDPVSNELSIREIAGILEVPLRDLKSIIFRNDDLQIIDVPVGGINIEDGVYYRAFIAWAEQPENRELLEGLVYC